MLNVLKLWCWRQPERIRTWKTWHWGFTHPQIIVVGNLILVSLGRNGDSLLFQTINRYFQGRAEQPGTSYLCHWEEMATLLFQVYFQGRAEQPGASSFTTTREHGLDVAVADSTAVTDVKVATDTGTVWLLWWKVSFHVEVMVKMVYKYG